MKGSLPGGEYTLQKENGHEKQKDHFPPVSDKCKHNFQGNFPNNCHFWMGPNIVHSDSVVGGSGSGGNQLCPQTPERKNTWRQALVYHLVKPETRVKLHFFVEERKGCSLLFFEGQCVANKLQEVAHLCSLRARYCGVLLGSLLLCVCVANSCKGCSLMFL